MATTETRETRSRAPEPDDEVRWRPGELVARLAPPIPGRALWGWLGPVAIMVVAGVLRFWNLGHPHAVVFDETYYAKDSLSLLKYGVEHDYADKAAVVDKQLLSGDTDVFKPTGSFIVHPQVGKWMIALGYVIVAAARAIGTGTSFDWHTGVTPFGWRFSAAVVGTLAVLILARTVRRMTRSTLLGCLAGLLLCCDALEFVQSRVALLDIFLMFWLLAAFSCLVADRSRARRRLALLVEERGLGGKLRDFGPWLGARGWRIGAGVCLGLALGTKWTALWYIAAFGLLTFAWDVGARRAVGARSPFLGALALDAVPAFVSTVVVGVAVYVSSWASWFATGNGWDRHWTGEWLGFIPPVARNWLHYQAEIYNFHVHLTTHHDYQSSPWSWPLMIRPVAYYYVSPPGCGADQCSSAITGLGTPAIWWATLPILVFMVYVWLRHRDWRAAAVLVGALVGWIPWMQYPQRTMFFFYALPMLPFVVIGLTLAAGALLGRASEPLPGGHVSGGLLDRLLPRPPVTPPPNRRVGGAIAVGAYTLLVVANFLYFVPILTAQLVPYSSWAMRMWLRSWI